ncbi:hypothetical protein C5167_031158 [Papaver somniferum]|nr:hypothetical protein C5167_031158 [Papaver somniferum]
MGNFNMLPFEIILEILSRKLSLILYTNWSREEVEPFYYTEPLVATSRKVESYLSGKSSVTLKDFYTCHRALWIF